MSLEKIREAFKQFKKNQDGLTFVEPETRILISEIAKYLLDSYEATSEHCPSPDYLSIEEFTNKYIFCAPNSIGNYCNDRDDFRNECAIKHLNKWYIHENKAVAYLAKIPRYKARIERGIFMRSQ